MSFLQVLKIGAVLQWTLDRPSRGSALGLDLLGSLEEALEKLTATFSQQEGANEPPPRVLVISAVAAGKKVAVAAGIKIAEPVWIAGGDLQELALLQSSDEALGYAQRMSNLCHGLSALPIPVIMALNGAAIGGGAEFALFGDLRYATESASFHFKQLGLGLSCGYGSTQRLLALVGQSRASGLLLQEQKLTARDAEAWGLVHAVVKDEAELKALVQTVAARLCELEPAALAAQKAQLNWTGPEYEARRTAEVERFAKLWKNPSHARALEAFALKRAEARRSPSSRGEAEGS